MVLAWLKSQGPHFLHMVRVVGREVFFSVYADHHSCNERVHVSIGMHGSLPSTACSKVKVMV